MASMEIEKVLSMLEAVKAQDADRAIRYVDRHFVQHDPNIAAGADGFRQYIVGCTPEQLQMKIVRIVQDGPHVVTQLKMALSGDDVFAVYRFQDGLIAEHWVFTAPNAAPNKSGHTQIDGPAQAKHLDNTEENKEFARRYYKAFHLAGDRSQNDVFFTGDVMIRHEPGVRDGLREFLHDVELLMQHRTIDEIKLLFGQGDLVFIAANGTHEGKPCVYIDLYRVENQKIVEHWGFPQIAPPQSERKNNNAML